MLPAVTLGRRVQGDGPGGRAGGPGLGDGDQGNLGQLWRVGPHYMFGWEGSSWGEAEPWHQASAEIGPLFSHRVTVDLVTQLVKTEAVTGPTLEPGTLGTVYPTPRMERLRPPAGQASWVHRPLPGTQVSAPGCPHPAPLPTTLVATVHSPPIP